MVAMVASSWSVVWYCLGGLSPTAIETVMGPRLGPSLRSKMRTGMKMKMRIGLGVRWSKFDWRKGLDADADADTDTDTDTGVASASYWMRRTEE